MSADPPAVRASNNASTTAPLAAGMARVVLIRPDSQCDSSAYPIVVDENGHFVAEMAQNSRTSIDMPAGEHVLFSWPSVDARVEKYEEVDPVGVANLHLQAGDTRYVEVIIPQRLAAQCWSITTFGLRHIAATDSELRDWLATTKPIAIDRAIGEAELARDPELVQMHIASGRREMEQDKKLRALRTRAQKSTNGE